MLILSRKTGQTIQISDQITITITQVKGKQVRIGIDAPADISIRRGELVRQQPAVKTQPEESLPDVNSEPLNKWMAQSGLGCQSIS